MTTTTSSAAMDELVVDLGAARATDFVRIAEEFGDVGRALLARTRAFVDDEVLPVITGFWERAVPVRPCPADGQLGLVSDGIDHPGVPPMSPAGAGLVAMELTRGDGSLATFAGVRAGPRDAVDRHLRLRRAEGPLAVAPGSGRGDRRLRADGTGSRLGLSAAGDLGGPRDADD